jgi:tetratricopeptide (TPR) repeat protein
MIRNRLESRARLVSACAALVLVLVAGAGPAKAAPPAGGTGGGSSSPAPRPAGGNAAPASPAAGEEASNHFKRGLQLFDEGDYTLALVEFERAYQLAPNYRALYNIALVNMQLGRYSDASRTLEKYLHDGGDQIAPTRLAEVKKTLGELKFRTATVDVAANVAGAEVTLDGKPLDPSSMRGPMMIDAGEHTLRATAPGYRTANRTVTLAGGDRAAVRLDLVALPTQRTGNEAPTRVHTIFWPGFAATAALTAGAIVSGVVMADARSHLSQLDNTPSDASSQASAAAQRTSAANRANTAALTADIFSGLAVVAGGVSLYLSLVPEHPAKSPTVGISLQKVSLSMPF